MERIKAEIAEAVNTELKEMQENYELMTEEKVTSVLEHVKQLSQKMQKEWEQLKLEQHKIVSLKHKVPGCTILTFQFLQSNQQCVSGA